MATSFQWTELFVKNSKQLVPIALLIASVFGYGGYVVRDVFPESKVVVAKETVPVAAKPSCNEALIAKVCGKVVRDHENSKIH